MTKEDVVTGNKLIAEFMGLKHKWAEYPNPQLNRLEVDLINYWAEVKYHSSWDWLMPAWVKFRDLIKIEGNPTEKYYRDYGNHLSRTSNAIINMTIIDAFERLVEAIQWYNTTLTPK